MFVKNVLTFHLPDAGNNLSFHPLLPANPSDIPLTRPSLNRHALRELPLQPPLPFRKPKALMNTPSREPRPLPVLSREFIYRDPQRVLLRAQLQRLPPFFL